MLFVWLFIFCYMYVNIGICFDLMVSNIGFGYDWEFKGDYFFLIVL